MAATVARPIALARLAALVLAFALFLIQSPEAADFRARTFMLDNGMRVVVIPDHRGPIITHMIWYKVGSADETPGKSGIAHVFEHLMFKGTEEVPAGEFSKIVARNGGRDNAFTNYDYTAYFQNVAADRLELVMRLEADRMTNLRLTEAAFAPELQVVIEERRMRTENQPSGRLSEQMGALQFMTHPYRVPVIGWMHELEKLEVADAADIYRTHYAPNNAILVIAGDVEVEQVRELAVKYYGAIPSRPVPPRTRSAEAPQIAARAVTLRDEEVRQARWIRTYLAPSGVSGATQHALPLQVLAELLGGGTTSRLYQALVVDEQIAASAGAFYSPDSLDQTQFGLFAVPVPGDPSQAEASVGTAEAGVERVVARLLEEGVGEEELERAKLNLIAAATYSRDSIMGMAMIYGSSLAIGETVEDVVSWPGRIAEVTADDVNAAAKFVFQDRHSVTGRLLPEVGE